MEIRDKILRKAAIVAVIGLGYVGLPMALAFCRRGFQVFGIDRDQGKIFTLLQGKSYIRGIPVDALNKFVKQGRLVVTAGYEALVRADVIILCLPTPLDKTGDPDLSMLRSALEEVARYLRREQLVVLESTSFPGTTEEIAYPILNRKGYRVGKDFYLAYSPERIDPGNQHYAVENIPKLVSGLTPDCTEVATMFYNQVVSQVVPVSSPKVAEMAKLVENIFRSVNIALVNELAVVAHLMGIDIWEALEVASTKPFGFMPFFPGPGVGGHCLPVDPVYLTWRAGQSNYRPRLVELASQINREVPLYVVDRIAETLKMQNCPMAGAKLLVLGVAYKKDIEDIRESPSLEIIRLLMESGASVAYHDPYVPKVSIMEQPIASISLTKDHLLEQDCLVIVTDHACYDYEWLVQHSKTILDTRNVTSKVMANRYNVIKL